MSKYSDQGSKERNLGGGIKPPAQDRSDRVIKEAQKPTTGIIGQKGMGKNGVTLK